MKYLLAITLILCYTSAYSAEDCTSVKEVNGTECVGVYFPTDIEVKARSEHSIMLQERLQRLELDDLQVKEVKELEGKSDIWQKEAERQAIIAQKNSNGFRNGLITGSAGTILILTIVKILVSK